jgi:hypothetical protein
MLLSEPIELFSFDSFLPVDGEDSYKLLYLDDLLSLDLFYITPDVAQRAAKRRINFTAAKYFFKVPFPNKAFYNVASFNPPLRGVTNSEVASDEVSFYALIEYQNSTLVDEYQRNSGETGYRHYLLFLHSAEEEIQVIAQSYELLAVEFMD